MAARKTKRAMLREWLEQQDPARWSGKLTEAGWQELQASLAPISESHLRHLLADAGVAVEQPFGGIRQKTFDELEQSLIEMEQVYERAREAGDRRRAQLCRNVVIQAKDHARLAARSAKVTAEKKAMKEEMIQWMLVWLENPGVFPAWVKLRRPKLEGSG